MVLEGEPDAEVTLGGGAHGVAGHHPEQLAPGRLVRRWHLVAGMVGAGGMQLPGQVADELPGIRQRGLDAGGKGVIVEPCRCGMGAFPLEGALPGLRCWLPCGGWCQEGSVLLRSGLSRTWDGQEEPDVRVCG